MLQKFEESTHDILFDGQKLIVSFWVINLESTRDSLNPQGDKTGIHQREIDKICIFINLKTELHLEVTMRLNSKKKT